MPDIVYVLTNPAMPGSCQNWLYNEPPEENEGPLQHQRAEEFRCAVAWQVPTGTGRALEKDLHITFAPDRHSPSREWFKTDPERVKAFLRNVPGQDVTPKTESSPETPKAEEKEERKSNPGTREKTERNQAMVQDKKAGMTYADIARKYERSSTFVRKTINRCLARENENQDS